jgi:hypothetical protein
VLPTKIVNKKIIFISGFSQSFAFNFFFTQQHNNNNKQASKRTSIAQVKLFAMGK